MYVLLLLLVERPLFPRLCGSDILPMMPHLHFSRSIAVYSIIGIRHVLRELVQGYPNLRDLKLIAFYDKPGELDCILMIQNPQRDLPFKVG